MNFVHFSLFSIFMFHALLLFYSKAYLFFCLKLTFIIFFLLMAF